MKNWKATVSSASTLAIAMPLIFYQATPRLPTPPKKVLYKSFKIDNVSHAAKSHVKETDDYGDFAVYDEIPESVIRLSNNPKPTDIQLTVNTAYQKGMYSNVTS